VRALFRLPAAASTAATAARLKIVAGIGGGLSLVTGLANIRRLWAAKPKLPSAYSKGLSRFLNSHRSMLLNLAASLAGPLLIAGTFLYFLTSAAGSSAAGGATFRTDVIRWLAVGLVLVGLWFFADLHAWSPHSFYYKRLASMFAIGRTAYGGP